MDKRLDQELKIDFKDEMRQAYGRRRPQKEPDWDNLAGEKMRTWTPGMADELQAKAIKILKNCVGRLEGTEPRKAWEPRSKSWPYTSMGLALMEVVSLLDTIADRHIEEAKAEKARKEKAQ